MAERDWKHIFRPRIRSRSPQPKPNMPQTSTNYPGETAQTSKQIPQRTSLKPPVMLPPSTTTAASTSASNRCSTLDEKPLPAPPAQESASQEDLSSSKDLWDEAYEQLQVEQPNVVTTYESFILRQGQSKKSTRAALRELTTFDSSNRQEQLKEVIEEQQKLYGDKQWEIKVYILAFHVEHLLIHIGRITQSKGQGMYQEYCGRCYCCQRLY